METMNEIMNGNHTIDVDNLINRTQKEDERNKNLMKGVFILYVICTVLYSFLLLFNPDPELTLYHRLGGLCYVMAFLIGAIYFRREYKIYKNMDYTMPLLQLLERTEKRYRFFSRKWIPIIVVVILIDLGISLTQHARDYPFIQDVADNVLIIQAGYWILVFVSGFIGYLIWKKRSYPIWKDSKTLLSELKD
jgi:glycopeptide antibiotics resistance protein